MWNGRVTALEFTFQYSVVAITRPYSATELSAMTKQNQNFATSKFVCQVLNQTLQATKMNFEKLLG